MKSYLNLGCGARFSPDWTNIDFVSSDKSVIQHDLRKGIPFPDDHFEVVYHSHVLEHFPRHLALPFLQECRRVLKKNGLIRVVVPDLEQIARLYLDFLGKAEAGDIVSGARYEWMMLEMFDQSVRDRPGGEMGKYLRQEAIPEYDFVMSRGGAEAKRTFEDARERKNADAPSTFWREIKRVLRAAVSPRETAIRIILGREYESLNLGRFRRGGEAHLWMYDRYSLTTLLLNAGFLDPRRVTAADSNIPNWLSYNFDTEPDGAVYKPESIFLEAHK